MLLSSISLAYFSCSACWHYPNPIAMPGQALPSMLNASNSAFALATIRDRLPVILVKTLDDLFEDVKSVVSEMSKLRYEIMTNKPLVPLLPEPDTADIDVYNETILKRICHGLVLRGFL
ncbi:Damage-control phosphatase ARMT1 [Taenia crassiceps]|uniref:Damage-control phosphatase ARMT1 n=1 Tax=Taenia crassiceps TaxID=6207 RepID=A0ABR4QQN6_9CEST